MWLFFFYYRSETKILDRSLSNLIAESLTCWFYRNFPTRTKLLVCLLFKLWVDNIDGKYCENYYHKQCYRNYNTWNIHVSPSLSQPYRVQSLNECWSVLKISILKIYILTFLFFEIFWGNIFTNLKKWSKQNRLCSPSISLENRKMLFEDICMEHNHVRMRNLDNRRTGKKEIRSFRNEVLQKNDEYQVFFIFLIKIPSIFIKYVSPRTNTTLS